MQIDESLTSTSQINSTKTLPALTIPHTPPVINTNQQQTQQDTLTSNLSHNKKNDKTSNQKPNQNTPHSTLTAKSPQLYSKHNKGPFIVFVEPLSHNTTSRLNPTTIGRIISPKYKDNLISITSSGNTKITIILNSSAAANKLYQIIYFFKMAFVQTPHSTDTSSREF
ncbi:hypothetical protein TKK_0003630 [Trichogramma kaykai]|uniref:Uncharacterized protein n=1 Tax=Trichogramma kaykai TaxID=54128 RepID=A0ABD2XP85_9HYME